MYNQTIAYYNTHAQAFNENTQAISFAACQQRFLQHLPVSARILDFGCGSGRDTKVFSAQGFQVAALDGSAELCRLAEKYTGIPVQQMLFQDFQARDEYHGIWACASLLHLTREELIPVLKNLTSALKPAGILYMSFKYGTFAGMRNGRYFHDFTEKTLWQVLVEADCFSLREQWISADVRPDRAAEKWLNVICEKRMQDV